MPDFPDYTRLFHLVGTEITIPINIEASDVTLDVNIASADVRLLVTITSTWAALDVNIEAADVTLDVSITASEVTIDFNFADQSVAVFDAAKWFAHEAQQVFVAGSGSQSSGSWELVASREVPGDRSYFLTVVCIGYSGAVNANVQFYLVIGGTAVIRSGGVNGKGLQFDTPIRLDGAAYVELYGCQWSGDAATVVGAFGGYDEIEEE